jgi:polysaccharide export outer membrane protein
MMTRSWQKLCLHGGLAAVFVAAATASPAAQAGAPGSRPAAAPQPPLVVPAAPSADLPQVPADYVIGAEDVLNITSRFHEDLSGDFVVRPDGKLALPLLKDVVAAGLTIEEFRAKITAAITPFLKGDPVFTVQPKQINSRKVYITGEVTTAGAYPLTGPRTVMQLIALAGGVTEYADSKSITVMRTDEQGRQQVFRFNYKDVAKGKNLQQNILLKPGDTVVVP